MSYAYDRDYPTQCSAEHITEVIKLLQQINQTDDYDKRFEIATIAFSKIREYKMGHLITTPGRDRFRRALILKVQKLYAGSNGQQMESTEELDKQVDGIFGPVVGPVLRGVGSKL